MKIRTHGVKERENGSVCVCACEWENETEYGEKSFALFNNTLLFSHIIKNDLYIWADLWRWTLACKHCLSQRHIIYYIFRLTATTFSTFSLFLIHSLCSLGFAHFVFLSSKLVSSVVWCKSVHNFNGARVIVAICIHDKFATESVVFPRYTLQWQCVHI